MTIAYRLDGALLPYETVRFNPEAEAAFPAAAWYGEPVVAGVIIEDSSGSLDIDGWHTFTVEETACAKPRIFTGWIAGKEISRGRDSNRAGAARVWNCDIVDQNALFSFEVFRSSAASLRPAETDVARVQAIIASHAMGGTPIGDNGRLSTAGPRTLDAANFVTQYPAQALFSTAGQCAKNFYAYWDESADEISIHYDAVGDGPAATISFSNVPGDYGPIESAATTCFAPSRDATLSQDPYNLYTGFLLGFAGGYTYQRNDDLIDDLSPTEFSPVNFLRDQFEQSSRIGRSSTASAYTAGQLERYGVEKVTIRFTATLPARAVNLAHAGDIVTVRFSHLPGYTSNTQVTIIRRNVRPVDGHDALYDVEFECADFEGATVGGGGGFPHQESSSCDVSNVEIVQSVHAPLSNLGGGVWSFDDWTDPPTEGNILVVACGGVSPGNIVGDWTLIEGAPVTEFIGLGGAGGAVTAWWKVADSSEVTPTLTGTGLSSPNVDGHLIELAGVDSLDSFNAGSEDPGGLNPGVTITPTEGKVAFLLTHISYSNTLSGRMTPDAGVTELYEASQISDTGNPSWWIGYRIVDGTTGTYDVNGSFTGAFNVAWGSITMAFVCSVAEGIPPLPGQPVPPNTPTGTVDGSNDEFTTPHPFAAGSLRVLHDGIDQTSHIETQDPDTGAFTLDYAPSAGSTIETYYQGHN